MKQLDLFQNQEDDLFLKECESFISECAEKQIFVQAYTNKENKITAAIIHKLLPFQHNI